MWSRGRQGIMIQACFSCSLLVLGTGSTHSTSWHENSGRVIIQRKMIFWTQKKGVGSWAGKTKWSPSTSGSILTLTSMEDSFLWVIFLSHWPPSSSRTLRTLYCLQPLTRAPFVSLECSQQGWLILFFFWLFTTPWIVAYQAPLSMEFSRQEYWSGLSFPSPAGSFLSFSSWFIWTFLRSF